MSSFTKNKEKSKESKDIKYYYFIPSYDVLNNENGVVTLKPYQAVVFG